MPYIVKSSPFSVKSVYSTALLELTDKEFTFIIIDKINIESNINIKTTCLDFLIFIIVLLSYSNFAKYKNKSYKSGKKALKNSSKFAPNRTEALRLMALHFSFTKNQKKTAKYFKRSIAVGEGQGALPELAKTYMEIGKYLIEKGSRFDNLNDLQGKDYLKMARRLFQELDMQWGLDEIDKIFLFR